MDMYPDNQFHTGRLVTPRITVAHGSINALSAERGASLAAFPRRARERSATGDSGSPVTVGSALRPPRFSVDRERPINHDGHAGETPRIIVAHGSINASSVERRA